MGTQFTTITIIDYLRTFFSLWPSQWLTSPLPISSRSQPVEIPISRFKKQAISLLTLDTPLLSLPDLTSSSLPPDSPHICSMISSIDFFPLFRTCRIKIDISCKHKCDDRELCPLFHTPQIFLSNPLQYFSRSSLFRILPCGFFGKQSTNSTDFGALYRAKLSLQKSIISSPVAPTPSFKRITA